MLCARLRARPSPRHDPGVNRECVSSGITVLRLFTANAFRSRPLQHTAEHRMDQQNLAPRSVARWNVAAAVALMIALVPVLGAAQQPSGNLRTIKPISNAVYAGL